jgi:hypothetical protein
MRPPNKGVVDVRGNEIVYLRPLAGKDEQAVLMQGFSSSASDSEIVIENKKAGAGVKISTNRPLVRELLWSIRTVLAVEPYIAIDVQPGAEFSWTNGFQYYTLPAGK